MPALAPVDRPPDFDSGCVEAGFVDDAAAVLETVLETVVEDEAGVGSRPLDVFGTAPPNSNGMILTFVSSLQQLVSTPQHHLKDPAVPSHGVMIAPVVPFPEVQSSAHTSKHFPVFQSCDVHVSLQ